MHKSLFTSARTVLIAVTCLCAVLVACGNKNKRPDSDLVSDKDPVRGFLATIPADTPFAFVAIEPMPLGQMLTWVEGWAASIESMLPNVNELLADPYVDPETKLVYAVISEMSGNYNVKGFKKLGLSASPRFAIYGIGVLPALRMDLDDPDAFRALVQRVETRSGFKSVTELAGETEFWSYPVSDGYVVMSIVKRQLVWGFTPRQTAQLYTSYLVGETLPEKSMANDDLISPIAQKHGFQKYGTGFIDLARLAHIWNESGTGLNHEIQALLEVGEREPRSPECLAETRRLVQQAPRIVFGYEEWTASRVRAGLGLELTNDLGQRLAATKTASPLVGSEIAAQAPLAAGFGFDVGQVVDLVNGELLAIQSNPYQCAWYEDINDLANEFTAYSALAPRLVTDLRGGAVIVQNLRMVPQSAPLMPDGSMNPDPSAMGPSFKVDGIALVNSSAPSSLLAWLRTLAPEFENVTPDPGGIPLALPPSEMLEELDDPHLVLSATSLALTSGAGLADEGARLAAANPTGGPFFSVVYDLRQALAVIGATGLPGMTMFDALGRTEISVEPRDTGVFLRFEMETRGAVSQP